MGQHQKTYQSINESFVSKKDNRCQEGNWKG